MTTEVAADQLLEAEMEIKAEAYDGNTKCIGLARIGTPTQSIISGTMSQFSSSGDIIMGEPLHSFVICSDELHPLELEMFDLFLQK